jgi:threonine synthase
MNFVSTLGRSAPASLEEALFRGLAPDGGLYIPEPLPKLAPSSLERIHSGTWPERAREVVRSLFKGSLEAEVLDSICAQALDFPLPVVGLTDQIYVLELFHGPTQAFKDFGARFLAGLMSHFRKERDSPTTVLTATSGDTGGAVAQAFAGKPGIRVVVLFPEGRVTPRQERQFSTLGGNVLALAVQGDFDDCQRLAKETFQDRSLSDSLGLTSANSINVGRFLPQATYFFELWAQVQQRQSNRTRILISVPSGNFGNLAAGLLAKSMGMDGVSFLAATNQNDTVPEYLLTGNLRTRPSVQTLSTAMDVGNPSNLSRILHLYGDDLNALRKDVVGRSLSDEETQICIRSVHEETGHVLDPHSAVGYGALKKELESRPEEIGVVLATAHPSKFAEVVEPVLGQEIPMPAELAACLERERKVTPVEPSLEALREVLQS